MDNMVGNKDIAASFLTTTSMKGVPRILKSSTTCLKVTWFIVVFVCFGINMYQCFLLLKNYYSYPIETVLSVKDTLETVDTPDIVICNANPLSSKRRRHHHTLPLAKYYGMIKNQFNCANCTDAEKRANEKLISGLKSKSGYFQYIGVEKATLVGHTLEDFVLSCEFKLSMSSGTVQDKQCLDMIHESPVTLSQYFNCYILQLTKVVEKIPTLQQISMVMYLDSNFDTTKGIPPTDIEDSGIVVSFVKHNTYPIITPATSLRIPPGTHSVMSYKKTYHKRLSAPYGICSEVELNHYGPNKMGPFIYDYSIDLCQRDILLNDIRKRCQCDFSDFFIFTQNKSVPQRQLPFCQDASQGKEFVEEMNACINEQTNYGSTICPLPCESVDYFLSSSYNLWPVAPFTFNFYKKYVEDRSFSNMLPRRLFGFKSFKYANVSNEDLVSASNFISTNFMKLHIIVSSKLHAVIEEKQALTQSSVLSQLGGTLNLFSGITVIFFVEILELLWRLCTQSNCNKCQKRAQQSTLKNKMNELNSRQGTMQNR